MAEEDKVATRKTFHGTHRGEFMSIPPSGRSVSMALIDVVRITDGRVVEHWSVADNLSMMQQLGVILQSRGSVEPLKRNLHYQFVGTRCGAKATRVVLPLERFAFRQLRIFEQWQVEGPPCPPADVTLNHEAAPVGLGDAIGDG